MRAFEVHLNGKRLCVAGIGEDGVLTAIITDVARKDGNDLDLTVGGLVSRTGDTSTGAIGVSKRVTRLGSSY